MKCCAKSIVLLGILFFETMISARAASWVASGNITNLLSAGGTATLLFNGLVLATAGAGNNKVALYDPTSGSSMMTASMHDFRGYNTATLLTNGQVFVAGGYDNTNYLGSAETYNPLTGQWQSNNPMSVTRSYHTATLLPDGRVLVCGGFNTYSSNVTNYYLSETEIFDPTSGTWNVIAPMNEARQHATATLLTNGTVLVCGGINKSNSYLVSAELFDPTSQTWTYTGSLNFGRMNHTATLLANGKVLVAGGFNGKATNSYLQSAELYDPATGKWTTTGSMTYGRLEHSASLLPNGQVMVVCGDIGGSPGNSVEVYDPVSGNWSTNNPCVYSADVQKTLLLPGGSLLFVAGYYTAKTDLGAATCTATLPMATNHYYHTATLLGTGNVLISGGYTTTSELYDPVSGQWSTTGTMNALRARHTATLLADGQVLVAGGYASSATLASTEIYDPHTGVWTNSGSMNCPRSFHTATLLPNGKVLVAGGTPIGTGLATNTAEIFDPATGFWTMTGAMNTNRSQHAAVLLLNGKVLVAGGNPSGTAASFTAELYDPVTGTWTMTGKMHISRPSLTMHVLPNGKVIAEGQSDSEIYDPATGTWTNQAYMNTIFNFQNQAATMLPDCKVLVTGGVNTNSNTTELYDAATGLWTNSATLTTNREFHTETLLPNGKVLLAGGAGFAGRALATAEIYDPGLGSIVAFVPQVTSVAPNVMPGSTLNILGTGFTGVSAGSGGNNFQNSATCYPLAQLRNIETGQTTFLATTNWGTNFFDSVAVTNFPPGPALLTVFVNGVASTSSVVSISVPVPVPTQLTGAVLTNQRFQLSYTNTVNALLGVCVTTNPALPLTNWTKLGQAAEIMPGMFQFTDSAVTNSSQRFYQLFAP